MKRCKNPNCPEKKELSLDNFYTFKQKGVIKYHAVCKECFRKRVAAYRTPAYQKEQNQKHHKKYKDVINKKKRLFYSQNKKEIQERRAFLRRLPKNKEKQKELNQKYYQKNKDKLKLDTLLYRKNNPHITNAESAFKRARKRERTPKWLSEKQKLEIQEFYKKAVTLAKTTGIPHHVDHIVPLCGKNVSGLHVPWNLRVITAEENMRKHNNF